MQLKHPTRAYAEIIVNEFLNQYADFEFVKYDINENEFVLVISDSLVLYIKYDVNCDFMDIEENRQWYLSNGVCGIDIEEVTPNTLLPKYKHSPLMHDIQDKLGVYTTFVRYARFKGVNAYYLANGIYSHTNYIIEKCPEVRLQERLDAWEGTPYTIVIFEMKGQDGHIAYAADAIKGKVHPFVLRVANKLMENVYGNNRLDGILSENNKYVDKDFLDCLFSYRRVWMVKRLQENLTYYSLPEQYFREEVEIYNAVKDAVVKAKSGAFDLIERIPYSKPEYKWKTEEYVLKIIKKHYKEYGVIYQHRPFFLQSSFGGQMSYDIFISKYKIAIEYQGKQHFEPVDFFGGEEAFEKVKLRDEEKQKLSLENGIELVYFNYWEQITPELICERIGNIIKLREDGNQDA